METGDSRRRRAVYVISVAAEITGMHPQTLRIYERKGLVQPARTGGGSRRYSAQNRHRDMWIAAGSDGVVHEGQQRLGGGDPARPPHSAFLILCQHY